MTIILILSLAVIVILWFEIFRLREYVIGKCQKVCKDADLQLLDQTVALTGISFRKSRNGPIHIHRTYEFEYSTNGTDRLHGFVDLIGRKISSVRFEGNDGLTTYYQ